MKGPEKDLSIPQTPKPPQMNGASTSAAAAAAAGAQDLRPAVSGVMPVSGKITEYVRGETPEDREQMQAARLRFLYHRYQQESEQRKETERVIQQNVFAIQVAASRESIGHMVTSLETLSGIPYNTTQRSIEDVELKAMVDCTVPYISRGHASVQFMLWVASQHIATLAELLERFDLEAMKHVRLDFGGNDYEVDMSPSPSDVAAVEYIKNYWLRAAASQQLMLEREISKALRDIAY